jgi:hypothetical protein
MATNNRRPQVPSLGGRPALQPSPVQSDTYVQPQQREKGSRLIGLANALGTFNSSLAQAGGVYLQKQQEGADVEAARILASRSASDWNEAVRSGAVPAIANPYVRAAVEKSIGQTYARDIINGVQNRINNGEIDLTAAGMDMDQYISELLTTEMDGLSTRSRFVQQGFASETSTFRNWGIEVQQEALAVRANEDRFGAAYNEIRSMGEYYITQIGSDSELNPQTFADNIHRMYADLASLNLTNPELDAQTIRFATEIAATNPEYAAALLNTPRIDARTGQTIPAISANPNTRDQALRILGVTGSAIASQSARASQASITQNAANLLMGAGNVQGLSDTTYTAANGEQVNVTRDQQITNGWREVQTYYQDQVANHGMSRAQAFTEQIDIVRSNGIVHTGWQDILQAIPGSVDNISLSDPAQRTRVLEAIALYENLSDVAAPYLDGLIDERTKDFFENYRIGVQMGGLDQETALRAASEIMTNGIPVSQISQANIRNAVDRLNGYGSRLGVVNDPLTRDMVIEGANRYMSLGRVRDVEEAVRRSYEDVRNSSTLVNGYRVESMGLSFDEEFTDTADGFLREVFEDVIHVENPDLRLRDMRVVQVQRGVFQIWENGASTPVWGPDGVIQFTMDGLHTYRERLQLEEIRVRTNNENLRLQTEAANQRDPFLGRDESTLPRFSIPGLGNAREDALAAEAANGGAPQPVSQPIVAPTPAAAPAPVAPAPVAAATPTEQPNYAALPAWAPTADVIHGVVADGNDNPIRRTPENIRLAQEYLSRNPIRGLRSLTTANFYMMMLYTGQERLSLIETLAGTLEISVSEIMGKINP